MKGHAVLRAVLGAAAVLLALYFLLTVPAAQGTGLLAGHTRVRVLRQAEVTVGQDTRTVSLPHTLDGVPHGAPVTVRLTVEAAQGESLQVKSLYAPLIVRVGGREALRTGERGDYPSYMIDPPPMVRVVDLPQAGGPAPVELAYRMGGAGQALTIPPVLCGERLDLFAYQLHGGGLLFVFSAALILMGAIVSLLSVLVLRAVPEFGAFLWLGMLSLCVGLWGLGQRDIAAYIIPNPFLLYHLSHFGLFSQVIPFLRFGLAVLRPRNRRPLEGAALFNLAALLLAAFLQLAGVQDYRLSARWCFVLIPASLAFFGAVLIAERLRVLTPRTVRLFWPGLILVAVVLLEALNCWLRLFQPMTIFFFGGIPIFVWALALLSRIYVRDALAISQQKLLLEKEVESAAEVLALYGRQYRDMVQLDRESRRQRHDMRHQLAVLRSYNAAGEKDKLERYAAALLDDIPVSDDLTLCENKAVNAVAAKYVAAARRSGIQTDVRLSIPEEPRGVREIDLCIMVGNIMENALEACLRAADREPFIKIRGDMKDGGLHFVCENRYDGKAPDVPLTDYSSKREGAGIGLRSVEAVAHKYGGVAAFEAGEDVFLSTIVIRGR